MADLMCANCGEPWDFDYVIHDEPEEFVRKGSLISRCPNCRDKGKILTKDLDPIRQMKTMAAVALADVMGDDLDGFAAEMAGLEIHAPADMSREEIRDLIFKFDEIK